MSQKVVVIGIDGATWDLIRPWCQEGELPALARILRDGVWSFLESTIPPITAPAWVSFSTGRNPGKHGIFDFIRIEGGKLRLNSSKNIKSTPIHQMLSAKGFRSVMIGLPLSYPPSRDFNGVMVSDFLYPDKGIFPPEKSELISDYRVSSDPAKTGEELLEDILDATTSQVRLAKKLFSEEAWNLFFILFRETDTVFHNFWREIKNKTQFGQKAVEVFRIIDGFIAWILDQIQDDTTLIIVSDHGFTDYRHIVRINKILLEKGLLKTRITKKSEGSPLEKHIKTAFGNRKREMKLPKLIYTVAFHPLVVGFSRRVYGRFFRKKGLEYSKQVDFERSKAYNPTPLSSAVYISRKLSRKEYEQIREEVVEILRNLEYKGQKVVKEVFLKEQVYFGPYTNEAPDLLVETDGFILDSGLTQKTFDDFSPGSYHHQMGIFAAYGSGIKKGVKLEKVKIYDIAPTILYILDLPVPEDLDGRVLTEIFIDSMRKPKFSGSEKANDTTKRGESEIDEISKLKYAIARVKKGKDL